MPIMVQHGPDQSHYASVIAGAAKKTENYNRMKQIAEFMQAVKQQDREYELGKERNELTGRGLDIQHELGLKDMDLRTRGLNLEELAGNRNYELGLRAADLSDRELELLRQNQAMQAQLQREGYFMQNPNRAMNLYGTDPVRRDSKQNVISGSRSFYSQMPRMY